MDIIDEQKKRWDENLDSIKENADALEKKIQALISQFTGGDGIKENDSAIELSEISISMPDASKIKMSELLKCKQELI